MRDLCMRLLYAFMYLQIFSDIRYSKYNRMLKVR